MLPRFLLARASVAAVALMAVSTVLGVAATPPKPSKPSPAPSPSASPSTATNCVVDPAMSADPQIAALEKHCQDDLAAINGDKSKLQDSIAMAQGSVLGLQETLKQTQDAIDASNKKQAELKASIAELEVQQVQTSRQMNATRIRLAQRRSQFSSFLRRSYKFQPQLWSSLFESKGISDFLSRATTMVQVQAFGHDLLVAVKKEEGRLAEQQRQIDQDHADSVKRQAQLVQAEVQLVDDVSRQASLIYQLQGSITDAKNEINNAGAQSKDLVAKIVAAEVAREDQLIQAANDAAWQAAQAWMASNTAAFPPQGTHSRKYPFIWPAEKGVISQGFGPTDFAPEPPGFGAAHFHAGVDVANNSGTPIFAAEDGVVASVQDSMLNGVLIGYGRHVVIAHQNGMMTLYGHLNAYSVKVGQAVHQGDLIGVMGSTGNSSGPHLHFELRVNNTPVDPMAYLPPNGPNDFKG
ncbi:MAG: murein hydrolase activator EnvC family protein [Candidatus Dormibacteria bacterium]